MSKDKKPIRVEPIPRSAAPSDDEPYTVGYGKPPIAHRFKLGQSGNRRGRPRRSRSTAAEFDEMFRSTVLMTVDGRRRRISVRKVMALHTKKEILKGNMRAIERWAPYAEKVEPHVSEHDPLLLDLGSLTEEQLRAIASIKLR